MTNEDRQAVANEAKKLSEITDYSYDKYIEFVKDLMKHHPFSYFSIAKGRRFSALWNDICEKTKFIDEHFSPNAATRIFYYINKLDDIVKCETCGNLVAKNISALRTLLNFFCCNRCAQMHESTIAKTKATKLKNHGDPNYVNMEKIKETFRAHYGVECSFQAEEVKEKSRNTIREKYGVDHQMQSQEVKSGMRARYEEKHGVEHPWQDPEVKKKVRDAKDARKRNIEDGVEKDAAVVIYPLDALKQKVLDIIEKHPHSFGRIIKSRNYDISVFESLKCHCPKVADDEYTIETKVYWLLNDIKEFPRCSNKRCNRTFEHKNVKSWKDGYHKHCCSQCAKDSDERKELYVNTCKEKYGVDNASQADEVKEKKVQSALDKYGVDNVAKAPEVQRAIQSTNMERYGATTYLHSNDGSKAVKQSCIEKYGVEHYSQTDEYIEKCKRTNQMNYGVDWPQKSREFMRNMQKRYAYDGLSFDSKAELAYYIWLKDHNVEFTYQPDVSFEYEHNNIKHTYEPDFIVENSIVELKGDHFFKEDGTMQNPFDHSQDELYEAKHQCMLRNNVKIIRSNEYETYIKYVESTYGKDYLSSFKNK